MRCIIIAIVVLFIVTGCNNDGFRKYEKLMAKEVASGKRTDSIFFGIYLGMPVKEFYAYCWDLNKKGTFTDGLNNQYVLYPLKHNELKFPSSMNFYPDFANDKILKMRVIYQYDGWAPWNKERFADTLLPDVLRLYKKWYPGGNDFIQMDDPEKKTIYVKVDNNRRITIGKFDDMIVKVDFTDLLAEKQLKGK